MARTQKRISPEDASARALAASTAQILDDGDFLEFLEHSARTVRLARLDASDAELREAYEAFLLATATEQVVEKFTELGFQWFAAMSKEPTHLQRLADVPNWKPVLTGLAAGLQKAPRYEAENLRTQRDELRRLNVTCADAVLRDIDDNPDRWSGPMLPLSAPDWRELLGLLDRDWSSINSWRDRLARERVHGSRNGLRRLLASRRGLELASWLERARTAARKGAPLGTKEWARPEDFEFPIDALEHCFDSGFNCGFLVMRLRPMLELYSQFCEAYGAHRRCLDMPTRSRIERCLPPWFEMKYEGRASESQALLAGLVAGAHCFLHPGDCDQAKELLERLDPEDPKPVVAELCDEVIARFAERYAR